MNQSSQTVFIVDDEPVVRKAVGLIVEQTGHTSREFASATEFLEFYDGSQSGCLISDVRMPGMDGMQLLQRLQTLGRKIPVVMLSAHGDIQMAVASVKLGAIDFLEKPVDPATLRQKVMSALAVDRQWQMDKDEYDEIVQQLATLTPREREVLDLLVAGKEAKIVAQLLGSSHNTVRVQRASIMKKMRADNIADLIRILSHLGSS